MQISTPKIDGIQLLSSIGIPCSPVILLNLQRGVFPEAIAVNNALPIKYKVKPKIEFRFEKFEYLI